MNIHCRFLISLALISLTTGPIAAQDWEMPRTDDGRPDLQGYWSNSSQTPLVRPEELGEKGFLTEAEAADVEQGWRDRYDISSQAADPERAPPTDGNADLGYNSFW